MVGIFYLCCCLKLWVWGILWSLYVLCLWWIEGGVIWRLGFYLIKVLFCVWFSFFLSFCKRGKVLVICFIFIILWRCFVSGVVVCILVFCVFCLVFVSWMIFLCLFFLFLMIFMYFLVDSFESVVVIEGLEIWKMFVRWDGVVLFLICIKWLSMLNFEGLRELFNVFWNLVDVSWLMIFILLKNWNIKKGLFGLIILLVFVFVMILGFMYWWVWF